MRMIVLKCWVPLKNTQEVLEGRPSYRKLNCHQEMSTTAHDAAEVDRELTWDLYCLLQPSEVPRYSSLILEVSELEIVRFVSQCPSTVKRTITLSSNYEMKLLLWGQRAREFEIVDVHAMCQEEPVVALFVGTLMDLVAIFCMEVLDQFSELLLKADRLLNRFILFSHSRKLLRSLGLFVDNSFHFSCFPEGVSLYYHYLESERRSILVVSFMKLVWQDFVCRN
ncbi:hypothetical protein ACP70R_019332 [Stipagrostis hirtigluma subsp. patula]